MTARRVCILAALALTAGCHALDELDCQLGVANRSQRVSSHNRVEQRSGGDAVNLSPTVAVTGGGTIAMVVMVLLLAGQRRSRRALRAVIAAIERLSTRRSAEAKREIARQALRHRTADYLHGFVKRIDRG